MTTAPRWRGRDRGLLAVTLALSGWFLVLTIRFAVKYGLSFRDAGAILFGGGSGYLFTVGLIFTGPIFLITVVQALVYRRKPEALIPVALAAFVGVAWCVLTTGFWP
jgi:hypothetical protein